ncbi:hypothetical protein [Natrinema versiforme]|uniref:Uncharacterized protein n=1 Tax=Natrinema versiforme TaxID=88724 RepID=A0A4P8WHJ7_9EURY|nr:hypothetical protein [Natrinema versiforme]QCS42869.1 hypothetical protein FEJ81_11055 [Natrinema versiforme]
MGDLDERGVTRRKLLGAAGGTTVVGVGAWEVLGCNSNVDTLEEDDLGSQKTITGSLQGKALDGSSITFSGDQVYVSGEIPSRYHQKIDETETGSCLTISGLVNDINDRDDKLYVSIGVTDIE